MRVSVLCLLMLAPVAVAQEEAALQPERPVVYEKVTVIDDFRDLGVEGEVIRPEGDVVWETPHGRFAPLIQLRTEFGRELTASLDAVR